MRDLDERFDPPTREQMFGEVAGVALAENGNPDHGPYIRFRAVCGAHGYFCSASFRDDPVSGGGATPREAMMSLAQGLRDLADKVIAAARPFCSCDLRATDGHHVRTCPERRVTFHAECSTCGYVGRTFDNEADAENDASDHEIAVGDNRQHHHTRVV